MVFTAAPNTSYKNARKKQNTLPYPYKFRVVEVCLVGAGDDELPVKKSIDNAF